MTKEEAIELIEKEEAYMKSHGGDNQAIALEMAIQSLEQIEQIKYLLKEWYLDSCTKGDDYMNEIREVLDK